MHGDDGAGVARRPQVRAEHGVLGKADRARAHLPPRLLLRPELPTEWLEDSDEDGITNTIDEDFAAGMEREKIWYATVEQARHARLEGGHMQPPPTQPQREVEEVDGDDNGLGDWPPMLEWDPGHMHLTSRPA